METTLHHYCFNTEKPEEREQWETLKGELSKTHRLHRSHSGYQQPITDRNDAENVVLDTHCLFNNQWNEKGNGNENGRRLFDWYNQYRLNGKHIRQGHYLELTPDMIAIRNNTAKCGYCGKLEPVYKGYIFCPHCIGNEYLTEDTLHLLRMLPVSSNDSREPLTREEAANLMPKWKIAQGLGKLEREKMKLSKNRRKVANLIPEAEKKVKELLESARVKTEAYTFLLDNEVNILENVIYYDHKKMFCFGWRKPLTGKETSDLLDGIGAEFPFEYELKQAD